ncbi:MAG: hypothetical protein ACK6CT_08875, partial [Planctomycetia bacterium]
MSVTSDRFRQVLRVMWGVAGMAALAVAPTVAQESAGGPDNRPVVETPVVVDGSAPPPPPTEPPQRLPAADGTSSVIVPAPALSPPATAPTTA